MLPDFPKIKRRRSQKFMRVVAKELRKRTPLFRGIRSFRQHEGDTLKYDTIQGEQVDLSYNQVGASLEILATGLVSMSNAEYIEKAKSMARELATGQTRQFFKVVDQNCNEAGNSFKVGPELTPENILEGWSRIDFDFDENRSPKFPTIVAGPEDCQSFNNMMTKAMNDPVFISKLDELLTQKWMDWRDREANRKLVE